MRAAHRVRVLLRLLWHCGCFGFALASAFDLKSSRKASRAPEPGVAEEQPMSERSEFGLRAASGEERRAPMRLHRIGSRPAKGPFGFFWWISFQLVSVRFCRLRHRSSPMLTFARPPSFPRKRESILMVIGLWFRLVLWLCAFDFNRAVERAEHRRATGSKSSPCLSAASLGCVPRRPRSAGNRRGAAVSDRVRRRRFCLLLPRQK